jgi:hypothetical protein
VTRSTIAIISILVSVAIGAALTFGGDSRWIGHAVTGAARLGLLVWSLVTGAMLSGRLRKPVRSDVFKLHRRMTVAFGSIMVWNFILGCWSLWNTGKKC